MANPEHVSRMIDGVAAWNGRRRDNPGVVPDLADAPLSRLHLQDADLNRASLLGAHLNQTDLAGRYPRCIRLAPERERK